MTTYRNVGGDGLRIFYREEGSSEGWNPIQKYWKEPNAANRDALRSA